VDEERVRPVKAIERWFDDRGWRPLDFQRAAWRAYAAGESGLVHAPTGTGKTYAVWFGPLAEALAADGGAAPRRLRVLWITPLRALANDTVEQLTAPLEALGSAWTVGLRTGDTPSSVRTRQRTRPPAALVTTPESLSVLLSYADAPDYFRDVRAIVVDEWHELMGSKRGVQTELGLAAVRAFAPEARTWGLSATLENLDEAARALVGPAAPAPSLVHAPLEKRVTIDTLAPAVIERFPWSGHIGTRLLDDVRAALDAARSTLLFTNTRSQAEIWFHALLRADASLLGQVALHHGSLDRDVRTEVEGLLRRGRLKAVVCTSSLDLGVDFPPVDQIIQVGSPKGLARLRQRAGRSGHRPDAVSRVLGVPTNALELIEFAAARDGLAEGSIEPRPPVECPLDVLVQHAVTRALGGGYASDELLAEVRTTRAYAALTDEEWEWVLDFVVRGGQALGAYPQYCRVTEHDGRYGVESRAIARMHRLGIGTITSDSTISVKFVRGRTIGTIEERFLARLQPGDRFVFAGRTVELVRVRGLVAEVRRARGTRGRIPRWQGGRSPLSTHLAEAVRGKLDEAAAGRFAGEEMERVRPLLELQARVSRLPRRGELLVETTRSADGHHVFLFTLEGRLVHEGLAALLAYRITRQRATSVTVSGTDWGIELLSRHPLPDDVDSWRALLSDEDLLDDLLACLDATQLARRHFREVARVAGLLVPGLPGQRKSARQLQASSDLFYDVFREYDPANLLLSQAHREVLDRQLEVRRLRDSLARIADRTITIVPTERLTPLAFPIWAERLREQYVTSERWNDRVRAMLAELEAQVEELAPC
jgi:ATP-dependent Lhr-like helicase